MSTGVYYICGPTHSGKTSFAISLAERLGNVVLINADIQQMYKGMETLAGSPTVEELAAADHRLFGIINNHQPVSPKEWLCLAKKEIEDTFKYNKIPFLVGGSRRIATMLAKTAYGIDLISPHEAHETKGSFPYDLKTIILDPSHHSVKMKIIRRLRSSWQSATKELLDTLHSGNSTNSPSLQLIGIEQLSQVLMGDMFGDDAYREIAFVTCKYARKQRGMFRQLGQEITNTHPGKSLKISHMENSARVIEAMRFISGIQ